MSSATGWLIAGGVILAYGLFAVVWNIRTGRRQRASSLGRLALDDCEFVRLLHGKGISVSISHAVHTELSGYCAQGVSLYPGDSLRNFLEIDLEERNFICLRLLEKLSIPLPDLDITRSFDPDTPVALARMLQTFENYQSGQPVDEQLPVNGQFS